MRPTMKASEEQMREKWTDRDAGEERLRAGARPARDRASAPAALPFAAAASGLLGRLLARARRPPPPRAGTERAACNRTHTFDRTTSDRCRGTREIRNPQSGQALLLAITIMLLLMALGTVFLRTVLTSAGTAGKSQAATNEYAAAEAGIRFVDEQLTRSVLGADWRPRPSYVPTSIPPAVRQQDPDWQWLQPFNPGIPGDPRDDVGGFTRYNTGDSRFLTRVTYNPNNSIYAPVMPDVDPATYDGATQSFRATPLSRFVMIESVGRPGSAADIDQEYVDYLTPPGDPIDPTVFAARGNSSARFRRELVAFKAIGINNYMRFVTDRDRLGRPTYLGVDQSQIRDGVGTPVHYPFSLGVDAQRFANDVSVTGWVRATGSPLRVNGDLVLFGYGLAGAARELTLNLVNDPHNVVEVANTIRREGEQMAGASADRMALRVYNPLATAGTAPLTTTALPATSDPNADFLTNGAGRVFDGAWLNADPTTRQNLDPRRSIRYLDPPRLETSDPSSGMLRYEAMTRNTAALAAGGWDAAARYGYGAGVYIDNARHTRNHSDCTDDIQYGHEPDKLRNDWLRPYAQVAGDPDSGWVAPGRSYSPKGVLITLHPDRILPNQPGNAPNPGLGVIEITRPTDSQGWRDPNGDPLPTRTLCFVVRPAGVGEQPANTSQEYRATPVFWDGSAWRTWNSARGQVNYNLGSPSSNLSYPFNGILYAEGNVRVRGKLPAEMNANGGLRLSVVSRGTIYIDGNLSRTPVDPLNPRSGFALMARDYVCLNTTQFVQVQSGHVPLSALTGQLPYFYWNLPPNAPERTLTASWDFGLDPDPSGTLVGAYYGNNNPALFVRHRAGVAAATMQLTVNNVPYQFNLLDGDSHYSSDPSQPFRPLTALNTWRALFNMATGGTTASPCTLYASGNPDTWDPRQDTAYSVFTGAGLRNVLRLASVDPGRLAPDNTVTTGGDYEVGALAIQPLDIRVSALIYAEHYSWFVIPGSYFQEASDPDLWSSPPPEELPDRQPQRGEPLDVQIHLIGTIAEGQAASLQDATLWTAHWRGGNRTTPATSGTPEVPSDGDADADPEFSRRAGISYQFDPSLTTGIRSVEYAAGVVHILPAVPRLPMCQDLVYFGERPVQ